MQAALRTAYDAATYDPTAPFTAAGALLAVSVGGAVIAAFLVRSQSEAPKARRAFAVAIPVLLALGAATGAVALAMGGWLGLHSAREAGEAIASGRAKVASGPVSGYAEIAGHHTNVAFSVDGVPFRYLRDDAIGNAVGPLRDGVPVRVSYVQREVGQTAGKTHVELQIVRIELQAP